MRVRRFQISPLVYYQYMIPAIGESSSGLTVLFTDFGWAHGGFNGTLWPTRDRRWPHAPLFSMYRYSFLSSCCACNDSLMISRDEGNSFLRGSRTPLQHRTDVCTPNDTHPGEIGITMKCLQFFRFIVCLLLLVNPTSPPKSQRASTCGYHEGRQSQSRHHHHSQLTATHFVGASPHSILANVCINPSPGRAHVSLFKARQRS